MTAAWWTDYWYYWLLAVFLSWLVMELASIVAAHVRGERRVTDWTLSDMIRRWAAKYRWLGPVVIGSTCFLLAHFFLVANPT
jgi:hypothetical protein